MAKTMTTFGTQDEEKHNTKTQHRRQKKMNNTDPTKMGEPRCPRMVSRFFLL